MHGVAGAALIGANNGYVVSVLTAEDGLTTAKYMWKIEDGDAKSNDATLDSVQIDGTDVTIATGRTEPKLESAFEVTVKKEFTLTAAATDAANAKVEIGSGDTLDNAVKNLSERNSVKVTQSTELNGGFVVIKVTAENGTTVQHYVYKLVLQAPTGN